MRDLRRPLRIYARFAFGGDPGDRAEHVLLVLDPAAGTILERRDGVPEAASDADLKVPALAPGLIDPHVHLNLPGDGTEFEAALSMDDVRLTELVLERAAQLLAGGVTTARDVGSRGRTTLDARDRIAAGAPGPRLQASGMPLTRPRGHCWWLGGEVADEPEAARAAVRARVAEGVDLIKVMASGGGTPGSTPWEASFSEATLRAIVAEAHAHGLKVSAHCLCAEATRRAVAAGVAFVEHAAFAIGPHEQRFEIDAVEALAQRAVPVSATLAVSSTAIRALESMAHRTPDQESTLQQRRAFRLARREQTARSAAAGVRFLAGSDAGWRATQFPAVVDELQELVASGLDPSTALAGATGYAADALGLAAGRLRAGAVADLVGLDGDPILDLGLLRHPAWVIQAGRVVARAGQSTAAGAA